MLDHETGLDSSQSSNKPKQNRSGPLTKSEIATEGGAMVYRIITSLLYRSRAASKIQLFHDLTYLFIGWSQHGSPVDQKSLTITWEAPLNTDIDYIDGLARTKVMRPYERGSVPRQEMDQSDLENVGHLENLISEHPELSIIIQHEVLVNATVCQLRYRMNLIEVACRYLAAYITLDSVAKGKDALSTDKHVLKLIIVLSIGLRKLLDEPIRDMASQRSVPWYDNNSAKGKRGRPKRTCSTTRSGQQPIQYKFEEINGFSLEQLQPPPSKQREVLNQMILKMTEQEYTSKMVRTNGTGRATVNDTAGLSLVGNDVTPIEADKREGVFAL